MIDFKNIKTYPIQERQNKFQLKDMIALDNNRRIDDENLKSVAAAIVNSKQSGGKIMIMLGGAVVKVGCSLLLIDLMKKGFIDHIAVNGAVSIHDFEVALIGETSEDVEMVEETSRFLNEAIIDGYRRDTGYGAAVGEKIAALDLPHKSASLFFNAFELNIPVTVHVAIGGDIIHQHPTCDGAALGGASYKDFKILIESVAKLKGGVLLNIGSAVNLPEVFLKALTIARNLKYDVRDFTTANFDFFDMYRPRTRLLEWPRKLGCQTYDIRADHSESIPTLHHHILQP